MFTLLGALLHRPHLSPSFPRNEKARDGISMRAVFFQNKFVKW
jgi:hypothetical protein